jgi:hypothetical protein
MIISTGGSKEKSSGLNLSKNKIYRDSSKASSSLGLAQSSQAQDILFEKTVETDYTRTSYIPHEFIFILVVLVHISLLVINGIQVMKNVEEIKFKC